jgi:hypothetical protein
LSNLFVDDKYRGKGYGKILIFVMFHHLKFKKLPVESVSLEDASDRTVTRHSIYYKLGFRIIDKEDASAMKIFFTKDSKKQDRLREDYKLHHYQYSRSRSADPPIYESIHEYLNKYYKEFHLLDKATINIYNILQEGHKQYNKLNKTISIEANEIVNNTVMQKKFKPLSSRSSRTINDGTRTKTKSVAKLTKAGCKHLSKSKVIKLRKQPKRIP